MCRMLTQSVVELSGSLSLRASLAQGGCPLSRELVILPSERLWLRLFPKCSPAHPSACPNKSIVRYDIAIITHLKMWKIGAQLHRDDKRCLVTGKRFRSLLILRPEPHSYCFLDVGQNFLFCLPLRDTAGECRTFSDNPAILVFLQAYMEHHGQAPAQWSAHTHL